jgi:predicted CXXCH cytochrome family protein
MQLHRRLVSAVPAAICLVAAVLALSGQARSQATATVDNPHKASKTGAPACSSCHVSHGGATQMLLTQPAEQLCLSCHDGTTQATDVVSQFGTQANPKTSSHALGPDAMACSDCHTPHRTPSEDTSLLRADLNGTLTYSPPNDAGTPIGDDFCYACHASDPANDLRGFESSIHGTSDGVPLPPSGSQIRCLACHEPHGSDSLFLQTQPEEQLCYECHTRETPNTSGGSDVVAAFKDTPNDTTTTDGNGIRIYHHPISVADQDAATRQVECVSCHNVHTASAQDTATTSEIADPTRALASDATWIPGWDPTSGFQNRGSNVDAYCLTCHVNPTVTDPIQAGALVPYDVRLVDDTSLDADGTPHDTFSEASWYAGAHGDPTLDPSTLTYRGCDARGLTGPQCTITCTACHDWHGSSNAYMLREQIVSPDYSSSTATITGFTALDTPEDRSRLQTFCLTCHPEQTVDHYPDQLCTTCHSHGSGL